LAGIAALVGLTMIGINAPNTIPGRSYYNVDVTFKNADHIADHAMVKLGGRYVGQVLDTRLQNGQPLATLQLKADVKPLLSDTVVKVAPRSAIGVRYIELRPGTRGRPIPEFGRIPATQTVTSQPLDEVLDTFNASTRARTQTLLRQLGDGVAGRGEDLNDAVAAAGPFLNRLGSVTAAIADRSGASAGLVRGADELAGALDPVRSDLVAGFRPEATTARAFTRERAALHASLAAAPPALRAVNTGLGQTRPLVREISRLTRVALPALREAPRALRETNTLLADAGPTLRKASGTVVDARRAVTPTLALLRTLRPEFAPLKRAMGSATPILLNLGPRFCDMRSMLGGWANITQYGTKNGNTLRLNISASAESLFSLKVDKGQLKPVQNPYPAPCEAGTEDIGGQP
jgi:ABC-type transporter Mla subunit MlaD